MNKQHQIDLGMQVHMFLNDNDVSPAHRVEFFAAMLHGAMIATETTLVEQHTKHDNLRHDMKVWNDTSIIEDKE